MQHLSSNWIYSIHGVPSLANETLVYVKPISQCVAVELVYDTVK